MDIDHNYRDTQIAQIHTIQMVVLSSTIPTYKLEVEALPNRSKLKSYKVRRKSLSILNRMDKNHMMILASPPFQIKVVSLQKTFSLVRVSSKFLL